MYAHVSKPCSALNVLKNAIKAGSYIMSKTGLQVSDHHSPGTQLLKSEISLLPFKFHFNSSLGKKVGWLTVTLSDVSLLCFSLLNIPSPNYEYIITTFWTYHHQTVNTSSPPFESSPFCWIYHHQLYLLNISSIHHRPVEYIITILSPPFEYIMTAFWMYHYRLLNIWELAVQVREDLP